jgi:branched-chain amino acid transport system permease protein
MEARKAVKGVAIAGLLAIIFLLPLLGLSRLYIYILSLIFIWSIVASSLRLLMLAGLLAFSIVGFMEIGAYATSLSMLKAGLPYWLGLLIGGVLGGTVALIIGKPILRLQSVYFFLVNMAFAEIISQVVVRWEKLTGGHGGIGGIRRPTGFQSDVAMYYLILFFAVLVLFVLYRFHVGRFSKILYGIRVAEPLEKSIGLDVAGYKLKCFVIICIFSALAGGLYAPLVQYINPASFGSGLMFYLIAYVVVGGQMIYAGPIAGTAVMRLLSTQVTKGVMYEPIIFGGALILFSLLAPEGIVGSGIVLLKKLWSACANGLRRTSRR